MPLCNCCDWKPETPSRRIQSSSPITTSLICRRNRIISKLVRRVCSRENGVGIVRLEWSKVTLFRGIYNEQMIRDITQR
jgi:hypothetical protein